MTHTSTAITAKDLREDLKNAFPGFKFSVRSKNFSMGSSIDIDWIDGPTEEEVKSISSKYEDIDYDEYTGEILSGGNRYVGLHRDNSPEVEEKIWNELANKYACFDGYTLAQYNQGMVDWDVARIFRNTIGSMSFYNQNTKQEKKEEKTVKVENNSKNNAAIEKIYYEGDWTWIKFSGKPEENVREILKNKFSARFSGKRIEWYITNHVEEKDIIDSLNVAPIENTVTEENKEQSHKEESKSNVNTAIADKLQKLADNMTDQIENKINPACGNQNYTARRARMAASMMEEGYKLEKIQRVLYALSDMHREGTINPLLANVTSKATIETIFTYGNFMDCKRDSWMYELRSKLEKNGINHSNYDEIKSEIMKLATGGKNREEEKRKRELENKAKSLIGQIPGFFPTPPDVAKKIVEEAEIQEGNKVLEPSAGSGNIAEAILNDCSNVDLDTIEYNYSLQELLKLKGFNVIGSDFMEYSNGKRFDRIVMNPPFENMQDVDHVKHAYDLLGESGKLVSIMSVSPFFRSDKKAVEFRNWFDSVGGVKKDLPEGSFKSSLTGVNTCYVVIEKSGVIE